jgi:hypothetical protein
VVPTQPAKQPAKPGIFDQSQEPELGSVLKGLQAAQPVESADMLADDAGGAENRLSMFPGLGPAMQEYEQQPTLSLRARLTIEGLRQALGGR